MICFSTFNKTKRRFSVCNQKGIPKGKTFENLQVQIFIGLPLGVLSFVSFSLHKQRKAENAHASRCSNHSVFSAKKTGTRLGAAEKEMILAENLFSLYKILNKLSRVFCGTRFAVLESLRIFHQKSRHPFGCRGEGDDSCRKPISLA